MDKRLQEFLTILNKPVNIRALTSTKWIIENGIQPEDFAPFPYLESYTYWRWFYKLNKIGNEIKIYGPNALRYEGPISGLRITFGVYKSWQYSTQTYVSFDKCHNPGLQIHCALPPELVRAISQIANRASKVIRLPVINGQPDTLQAS